MDFPDTSELLYYDWCDVKSKDVRFRLLCIQKEYINYSLYSNINEYNAIYLIYMLRLL